MIEVMDAEFVAVARAKGLGELRVLFAHVARNALVPTVTLLGLNIAYLIGSTVIVEQVFNLNGLGSLLLELDPQPRLPRRTGHHPRAGRRRRAAQPGHRPGRRPPRPEDPAAMSTPCPAPAQRRRTRRRRRAPSPVFWHRARHSPTFIAGASSPGLMVLVAVLGPARSARTRPTTRTCTTS